MNKQTSETKMCDACDGRGRVTIPSYDMEVPAFSNDCSKCRGSGRIPVEETK